MLDLLHTKELPHTGFPEKLGAKGTIIVPSRSRWWRKNCIDAGLDYETGAARAWRHGPGVDCAALQRLFGEKESVSFCVDDDLVFEIAFSEALVVGDAARKAIKAKAHNTVSLVNNDRANFG